MRDPLELGQGSMEVGSPKVSEIKIINMFGHKKFWFLVAGRQKILNFNGPEIENIDFCGPATENIDF